MPIAFNLDRVRLRRRPCKRMGRQNVNHGGYTFCAALIAPENELPKARIMLAVRGLDTITATRATVTIDPRMLKNFSGIVGPFVFLVG
jgi:hypothetical protein